MGPSLAARKGRVNQATPRPGVRLPVGLGGSELPRAGPPFVEPRLTFRVGDLPRTAATLVSMLRTVLALTLGLSVIGGTGVVALRTVGENTKETFDTLNEAFADAAPVKGRASTEDIARWIER